MEQALLADRWQTFTLDGKATAPWAARLTGLAVLRFEGDDALTFLQGYLTIDTASLAGGAIRLAAMTSIQGRVVADGWCRCLNERTLDWVVDASLTGRLSRFLAPYLAFSRTKMTIRDDDHLLVGCRDGREDLPDVRIVDDPAALDALCAGHRPVPEALWRAAAIDAGLVLVSEPVSERFLPQMLGLVRHGAVDFDKGCYLGQEVVARTEHRGQVKRQLITLGGAVDPAALAVGGPITDPTGREAGVIVAVAGDPGGRGCRALAVAAMPATVSYLAPGLSGEEPLELLSGP